MTNTDYTTSATWAEITAQPGIWRGWATPLADQTAEMRDWIDTCGADEIWLSGAGTSAFIGDLIAAALDGRRDVAVRAMASTDLVASPARLRGRNPLVISFGRSGNSAESLGVMDALDALAPDAPRLNITCNSDSALARRIGGNGRAVILPEATHDSGFAMTSSYTTMVLTALSLLDPARPDPVGQLNALADRAEILLPQAVQLAENHAPAQRIVFTGSGALQFAAREAALKVMELTGGEVAALWDSSLGFRHGPKSFVLKDTDLMLFTSSDPYTARYDRDLAQELAAQFPNARRIEIGPGTQFDTGSGDDAWNAVLYVLVAQVLATVWSGAMGFNIDNPFEGRGTLTRVVSGVTLYDPAAVA